MRLGLRIAPAPVARHQKTVPQTDVSPAFRFAGGAVTVGVVADCDEATKETR